MIQYIRASDLRKGDVIYTPKEEAFVIESILPLSPPQGEGYLSIVVVGEDSLRDAIICPDDCSFQVL